MGTQVDSTRSKTCNVTQVYDGHTSGYTARVHGKAWIGVVFEMYLAGRTDMDPPPVETFARVPSARTGP